MNEPDEPFADQILIEALKQFTPAPVRHIEHCPLNIESLLYDAGYQAGQLSTKDPQNLLFKTTPICSDWIGLRSVSIPWAFSLLVAVMLLPVAFRLGRGSAAVPIDVIASEDPIPDDTPQTMDGVAASDIVQPLTQPDALPIIDNIDVVTDESSVSIAEHSLRRQAHSWLTQGNTAVVPKETLTAFYRPTVESLPRSNWIVGSVDPSFTPTPLSAGDFGKLSFDREINQR